MKTIFTTPRGSTSIRALMITVILVIISTFACAAAAHGIEYSGDNPSLSNREILERFFFTTTNSVVNNPLPRGSEKNDSLNDNSINTPNDNAVLSTREISDSLNDNPLDTPSDKVLSNLRDIKGPAYFNPLENPLDGPNIDNRKFCDYYFDVRIGGFDLPDPKIPNVNLQPRMINYIDTYIANLGTMNTCIEVLPGTGMIMLTRNSKGESVEPYPAPKDMYSIGYQLKKPSNDALNSCLIYDITSATSYYNLLAARTYPSALVPPMGYYKLVGGRSYDSDYVENDRYFLLMPATGDYYVQDLSNNPVLGEDGSYKTEHFEQFRVEISITVDLLKYAGSMGKEWEGAVLIPPRLAVAPDFDVYLYDVFGLTPTMMESLEYPVDYYPSLLPDNNSNSTLLSSDQMYLDITRTSNAPFIYITSQPKANTTIVEGSISESLSDSANVTYNSALDYQWYTYNKRYNTGVDDIALSSPIPGATNPKFIIPEDLTAFDSRPYYYYCMISTADGSDSVRSAIATVNVKGDSPEDNFIELKPSVTSAPTGTTFTVLASLKTGTHFDEFCQLSFGIKYDSAVLQLDDVQCLTGSIEEISGDNEVVITGAGLNVRDCDLVLLTFTVLDDTKIGTIDFINVSAEIHYAYRLGWFNLHIPYSVILAIVNDSFV